MNLSQFIRYSFSGFNPGGRLDLSRINERFFYLDTPSTNHCFSKFLVLPINKESIEVPLFAINSSSFEYGSLQQFLLKKESSELRIALYWNGLISKMQTIESTMKAAMPGHFQTCRLVKFKDPKTEQIYYISRMALFDKDFNPLIMGTWQFERHIKETEEEQSILFNVKAPLLHISPEIYTLKPSNTICSTIIKRLIKGSLETQISASFPVPNFNCKARSYPIQVIIGTFDSFCKMHEPTPPSVLIKTKDMLEVVRAHENELYG